MGNHEAKILFAGGGTGGHIYPALATIEMLKSMGNFEFLYVGGYRGLENEILPGTGTPFKKIWISGFQRSVSLRNLLFPIKVAVSLLQSWLILHRFKPGVVVGTGGYVSGPVVYLAAKMGIPTLIQEQDSYPGVTTRLLARYAGVICLPYSVVKEHFREVKAELLVTGNPVRKSLQLVEKKEACAKWDLDPARPVVFVFGGSQGAQSINNAIADLAEMLSEKYAVQFLWQAGNKNYPAIRNMPVASHPDVRVLDYIESMGMAYSAADIIVSRAGAITLAELALARKPVVLVPYPYAAANHQEHNARTIAEAGAALLVNEDSQFHLRLQEAIEALLTNDQQREKMTVAWDSLQRPGAAAAIAGKIIEIMKKV